MAILLRRYMGCGLEGAARLYDAIEASAVRMLFGRLLPSAVQTRLDLITLFRRLVKISALFGLLLAIGSAVFLSPKLLTISGMLFDLAGLARIFIDEEWDDITSHFANESAYPYGPPSHITREMFKDDNPDAIGEVTEEAETIARHLYWRRGLALVLVGFTFQLIGTVLG